MGAGAGGGAAQLVAEIGPAAGEFDYVGFVEGGDIVGNKADVIVTDGFTGNIALKTAEGTATFINHALRDAFRKTPLSRIAAAMACALMGPSGGRCGPPASGGPPG